MQEYVIVAESGSDIPRELAEKHNIYIVPMHVTFGDITKKDGHFPPAEVCMYYERTGAVPLTSGCNPGDFAEVFAQIDKEHPDCHILYLAYSAVTTCAYRSAEIAAEGRKNISFINTKLLTVGQCAAVVRLAEELEAHPEWSLAEIEAQAVRICASVEMSCLISNIDYMRAGGRVTNSAALIGNIFNIHPEIILDKDGYIKAGKKYRGKMRKAVLKLMDDYFNDRNLDRELLWLGCTHGFSEALKEETIQYAYSHGFKEVRWINAGGVITTHGGSDAFCISGYRNA